MKNLLGKSNNELRASAQVVDGKLILSLPNAITPVVWQMELTQAKTSALEVREDAKNKKFTLVLKTQKGETLDIAPFLTREEAVSALMAVSKALENAHGKIRPGTSASNENSPSLANSAGRKKGGMVLASIMVAILLLVWIYSVAGGNDASTTTNLAEGSVSSGVPVTADQYLSGQ